MVVPTILALLVVASSSSLFQFYKIPVVSAFQPSFGRRKHPLLLSPADLRWAPLHRLAAVPRYGPPTSPPEYNDDLENASNLSDEQVIKMFEDAQAELDREAESQVDDNHDARQFRALVDQVLDASETGHPEHIPSILARKMDYLLTLVTTNSGTSSTASTRMARIVNLVLDEAKEADGMDEQQMFQLEAAVETVLSFVQDFVEEAQNMDDQNKRLLGRIIKLLSTREEGSELNDYPATTPAEREVALDQFMEEEKDSFTPGFLRHLDSECQRIAGAPKMTPDSMKLLEVLRMIQSRILEELGQDLGEAAQVLGQLIGYESAAERRAVLEAGLTVRGPEFAKELLELTAEALEGFDRVSPQQYPDGVDPGLLECIREIEERCRSFVGFE